VFIGAIECRYFNNYIEMKSYVLLLVLSSIGTIALGQVKVKPQIPLMEEKNQRCLS
jgi:hypothetical protein